MDEVNHRVLIAFRCLNECRGRLIKAVKRSKCRSSTHQSLNITRGRIEKFLDGEERLLKVAVGELHIDKHF